MGETTRFAATQRSGAGGTMAESVSPQTRERITEAAMSALRTAPVSALSVRQVAESAGVTTSSVYKAFSSKYELFAVASRQLLVEQVIAVARGVDETAPPIQRLQQVLTGLFTVGRAEPFPTAYLFGMFPLLQHKDVDESVRRHVDEVVAEVHARLHQRIADAVASGDLIGDPDHLAALCATAAFGYLGMAVHSAPEVAPQRYAQFVVAGLPRP
jgi:AcrR family transcriptional regulator